MIRSWQRAIVVAVLLLGGPVLAVGCRSSTEGIAEEEFYRLYSLGYERLPLTTPNDLVLSNGYFHFIADTAVYSVTHRAPGDGALVDSIVVRYRLWRRDSLRLVSGAALPLVTRPDTYFVVRDTLRRRDPTGWIWLRERLNREIP